MPLIKCTHCGATGNAPEHILGQQVRCSKCKKSFVAATEDEEPAEDEAADEPEEEEEQDEEGALPSGSAISSRAGQRKPRREEPESDDDEEEDDEEEDEDEDLDVAPKRRIRRPSGGGFLEILTFRKFVGPVFIQIFFWLMFALLIGYSLFMLAMSFQAGGMAILITLVSTLLTVIFGTIYLRLITELMMVMFRVYEVLVDIRDDLRNKD